MIKLATNHPDLLKVLYFADYKEMSRFVKQYNVSPTAVYNTGRKTTDPRYSAPLAPYYFERLTKKHAAKFVKKPTAAIIDEAQEIMYETIKTSEAFLKDNGCCSVVSMATACNIPFEQAQALMASVGRKHGKGVSVAQIKNAYKKFNKRLSNHFDFRSSLDVQTKDLKTISQICREYSKGTYVLLVRGHILTIKNGVPQDWTKVTSRHRVQAVYSVKNAD